MTAQLSVLKSLFESDPNQPLYAPETLEMMRKQAERTSEAGADFSPVGHWTQGAARVANAIVGAFQRGQIADADAANAKYNSDAMSQMFSPGGDTSSQAAATTPSGTDHPAVVSALTGGQAAGKRYGSGMEAAATMVGKGEIPNNEEISHYLKTGGAGMDPAKVAWCAAFVNSSLAQAGQTGTGSNLARSFLKWGSETKTPQKGDVAVFSRGSNPTFGHVGFYDSTNPDGSYRILGGNQGNAVSYTNMPAAALLGFRHGVPMPVTDQGAPQTAQAPQVPPGPGGGVQVASADPSFAPQMPQGAPMAPPDNPAGNLRAPTPAMAPASQAPAAPAALPGAAGAAAQPQQMAQAGGPPPQVQRALSILQSPQANTQTKNFAAQIIQNWQKQNSPEAQLEMQKLRGDLAAQGREAEKYAHDKGQWATSDEAARLANEKARGDIAMQPGALDAQRLGNEKTQSDLNRVGVTGKQDDYRAYVADQTARGLPAKSLDDWQSQHEKASAMTTEGALDTTLGKGLGEMYVGMINDGNNARTQNGQLETLRGLLQQNPGGLQGGLIGFANENGIPLGKNPSAAQAAQSIIAKLVPAQRVVGSGSTSDYDARMFTRAMPSLMNQQGGNEMIIDTFQALNDYKARQGDIATALANKEIDQPTASKMLKDLGDPFAGLKQAHPEVFGGKAAPAPQETPKPGSAITPSAGIVEFMKTVPAEGRAAAIEKLRSKGIDVSGF